MKQGRLTLLLCILVGLVSGAFYLFNRISSSSITCAKPYFLPVNIKGISSAQIPYCAVCVGDQVVDSQIDLGYSGALGLPGSVLQEIKKKPLEPKKSAGFSGIVYNVNNYAIGEVKIGELSFFPEEVEELIEEQERETIFIDADGTGMDQPGKLGWAIFKGHNLLVDCKNKRFVLCDSLETLKAHGYPVESFTTVSLLLDRKFLEFHAQTDMGLKRCMLDTGSTLNMYNVGVERGKEKLPLFDENDHFDSERFQVGDKDFGLTTFNRIHSPFPFEVILGMEFFEDHIVFIDFAQRKLHFYAYPKEEISS